MIMAGVLEENLMTYESRVLRTPPKVDSLLLNNHPFAIATSYSSRVYQDGYAYTYEAGGVFNKDETARRRQSVFSSNIILKKCLVSFLSGLYCIDEESQE